MSRIHATEALSVRENTDESDVFHTNVTPEVAAKTCETCLVDRPALGHHCKYCDNCVLVFDHVPA